jgi:gas vesicle protein
LEKEIHELCDILLIRGQWINNTFSKEMSEALHQLLTLPEEITRLDEVLSDDGSDGSRLKAALLRIDRDHSQERYINAIIANINETAQELLNSAIEQLSIIEKHLKNLVEDVQKKHPEMVVNWRELNLVSKEPLAQQMTNDSKKISCFIQLMNLCAQ